KRAPPPADFSPHPLPLNPLPKAPASPPICGLPVCHIIRDKRVAWFPAWQGEAGGQFVTYYVTSGGGRGRWSCGAIPRAGFENENENENENEGRRAGTRGGCGRRCRTVRD